MSLPEPSSGAEEFLDAEIEIAKASPAAEAEVHNALDGVSGVESVTIAETKVTVRYDPTLVTRKDLVKSLNQAGLSVQSSDTHRDSPIAEIEDQVQAYLPSAPERTNTDT